MQRSGKFGDVVLEKYREDQIRPWDHIEHYCREEGQLVTPVIKGKMESLMEMGRRRMLLMDSIRKKMIFPETEEQNARQREWRKLFGK